MNNSIPSSRVTSVALTPEDLSNINAANQYADEGDIGMNRGEEYHANGVSHTVDPTRIREAKPEPESSYSKSMDTSSSFEEQIHEEKCRDYEDLLIRHKRQRNIFYTLVIGLSVALLGCLLGLIIVNVMPRSTSISYPDVEQKSEYVDVKPISKEISDPFRQYHFPPISAHDSQIAQVFADHSMYQTFYGVSYNGPNPDYYPSSSAETNNHEVSILAKRNQEESSYEIQHKVSVDLALLSRVTRRVRIVYRQSSRLVERCVQAINELNLNLKIYLSVSAMNFKDDEHGIREVLNSAPPNSFATVYIERDADEETVHKAYAELQAFLKRRKLNEKIKLSIIEPQNQQANPLELAEQANVAIQYINNDKLKEVYTNLETPSETSKRASYMTNWVCRVVPSLREDIEWFWANAFDDENDIKNGIFTQDREIKPAGLPRCSA